MQRLWCIKNKLMETLIAHTHTHTNTSSQFTCMHQFGMFGPKQAHSLLWIAKWIVFKVALHIIWYFRPITLFSRRTLYYIYSLWHSFFFCIVICCCCSHQKSERDAFVFRHALLMCVEGILWSLFGVGFMVPRDEVSIKKKYACKTKRRTRNWYVQYMRSTNSSVCR